MVKSPRAILATQYFLHFGVMGIVLPYFNLYCYNIGFTGFQIGTLSAVRTLAAVAFPLFWGALADRYRIRRPLYLLLNFASAGIWLFYLYTVDFTAMLLISIFYGIFYTPIIAFLEAFTMDILGKERQSYGRVRVWGSINFIIVVMVLGWLIDRFDVRIILGLVLAGSLTQALTSTLMPRFKGKKRIPGRHRDRFFTPEVMIFLFGFFLMLVSHGTYYGFFSIHLSKLGLGNTFIGAAWALASIAEIITMVKSSSLFRRISVEKVMVASFFVAALRWFLLFISASPAVILFSQLLHAITYGAFHIAGILYIDGATTPENKTFGQAVNNAVTYGLGMAVGLLFNGWFYETFNAGLFLISSMIAISGGLILGGYLMTRPGAKQHPPK